MAEIEIFSEGGGARHFVNSQKDLPAPKLWRHILLWVGQVKLCVPLLQMA